MAKTNSGKVMVSKAYYLCSCARELLDGSTHHLKCPVCNSGMGISRTIKYMANRTVLINGRVVYPECGVDY